MRIDRHSVAWCFAGIVALSPLLFLKVVCIALKQVRGGRRGLILLICDPFSPALQFLSKTALTLPGLYLMSVDPSVAIYDLYIRHGPYVPLRDLTPKLLSGLPEDCRSHPQGTGPYVF